MGYIWQCESSAYHSSPSSSLSCITSSPDCEGYTDPWPPTSTPLKIEFSFQPRPWAWFNAHQEVPPCRFSYLVHLQGWGLSWQVDLWALVKDSEKVCMGTSKAGTWWYFCLGMTKCGIRLVCFLSQKVGIRYYFPYHNIFNCILKYIFFLKMLSTEISRYCGSKLDQ